jgi:hypothetical protein
MMIERLERSRRIKNLTTKIKFVLLIMLAFYSAISIEVKMI